MRYFENGGDVPLLAKAERKSTVHRRVPLDLVVVPIRENGKVTGIGVHAGLWTSEALTLPPEEVPVLRARLEQLDRDFNFDPRGHSGKALRHSVASLPSDLLVNLSVDAVRDLVMMSMSLADRPRPALLQVRSILGGHLFSFVWLPREELTTSRRKSIALMLEAEVGTEVTSWSVELGDGDLALIRYTQYIGHDLPVPDAEALDAALVEMVKGWAPAVEAELIAVVGAPRATRLAFTYLPVFSDSYRSRTSPEDAAADILRLQGLRDDNDRAVRIWRSATDTAGQLHLKTYRVGGLIPLSERFRCSRISASGCSRKSPHRWPAGRSATSAISGSRSPARPSSKLIQSRAAEIEAAIADVLCGSAEDDEFNQLVIFAGLDPQPVVWLRSWFRYLRQTGSSFGLVTVVDALRRAPGATRSLVSLFTAAHDPSLGTRREKQVDKLKADFDSRCPRSARSTTIASCAACARWSTRCCGPMPFRRHAKRSPSRSILLRVPGLPAPVPWREIWVYSPRVEGIHLRGGPIARGGLRWSDRRDDFRTEILGLMKAQMVKNAVIVPTGAKGGFYPKQLPPASNRDAWLAEGTESYRIFIRSLLSITDNLVNDKVVHPEDVVIHDGDDPYFVVAADKGTATFSDVANAIALEHNFWLGDAFASGGSNGYDHKAMGITAKGAWISVQRHFLEMGIDVQSDPITVAGCGDMSGDVFGNGMLLSKVVKLVAAFDHRHIFIDPDPDPAVSWAERKRLFDLPRSSWDDYDRKKMSKGGGIYPRTQKSIELSAQAREALAIESRTVDPAALINAILKSPVDLIWFGGIGTYIKASSQTHGEVGDPANDSLRADASELCAKVIGEGANLAITQAGRIEFAEHGGRINTDFIDNSAGVDCSDNEVNIKIPLNREMREGRLSLDKRNSLLVRMTGDVSELVLEDNRLQTLALSIAESGGPRALPGQIRTIEILEASGRLDRKVEGLATSGGIDPPRAGESRAHPPRTRGRAVDVQARAPGRRGGTGAGPGQADGAAAVRRLPQADAQGSRERHPHAPAAQRNPRHQGRQSLRQPARARSRLRPDRRGRLLAGPGHHRVPGRRASARPRQIVARDRRGCAAGGGPHRIVHHRGSERPLAFVGHPPLGRRGGQRQRPVQDAGAGGAQDRRRRDQAHPHRGAQRRRRPARASAVPRRERRYRARAGPAVRARRGVRDRRFGGAAQIRRARADPRLHPAG